MRSGLAIKEISKTYGDLRALDEVSFDVRPGELFGFVGSNGAGKTTTMRIALGVLSADAGSVTLDGQPVNSEIRRRIGYMPADRGLYPKMKVGAQLTYFARLHGLSAREAAAAVQHWTERLDIAHRIDDTVDTLSTGNQQRVQLAAALVHDPQVLVLDEPFSGLDPVAVDVMSEVLSEKSAAGVPVMFSSHQLELVERLCDRVGILSSGALVAIGTVDELRADQPLRTRSAQRSCTSGMGRRSRRRTHPLRRGRPIRSRARRRCRRPGRSQRCAQPRTRQRVLPRRRAVVGALPRGGVVMSTRAPSSRNAIWLVAQREFTTRVHTKAFVISVAVILALIVGGTIAASIFSSDDDPTTVAVVGDGDQVSSALTASAKTLDQKLELSSSDETRARADVRDGKTDVAVISEADGTFTVVSDKDLSQDTRAVVETAAQRVGLDRALSAQNVDADEFANDIAGASIAVDVLDPADPDKDAASGPRVHRSAPVVLRGLHVRAVRRHGRRRGEGQPGRRAAAVDHQAARPAARQGHRHRRGRAPADRPVRHRRGGRRDRHRT